MLGLAGEVISWNKEEGKARIRGEIWKVKSDSSQPISPGTQVRVTGVDGLTLFVQEDTQ